MTAAQPLPVLPSPPIMPAGANAVVSELAIAMDGTTTLEAAFRDRVGEVDAFLGHLGLHVWRDNRRPCHYLGAALSSLRIDLRASINSIARNNESFTSHAGTRTASPDSIDADSYGEFDAFCLVGG